MSVYDRGVRAIIYDRQSAANLASIEQQSIENREVCKRHGWNVIDELSDKTSASRYARKERDSWKKVLELIPDRRFDILILWEVSRADRRLEGWSELLAKCQDRNILIHITTHNRTYDITNARDWRSLAEDGVDAEYESRKTSARVKRDVRSRELQGRPNGKLLYGYDLSPVMDGSGRRGPRTISNRQGKTVDEIISRVANGESCYSIARDLNDQGVPAPRGKGWDGTQIKRIAINPAYIGLRAKKDEANENRWVILKDAAGQSIQANWPSIVDPEMFWKACEIATNPSRLTVTNREVRHLLTGIARTPCGNRVKLLKNRGKLSYQCAADFCVSIPQEKLDAYIDQQIPHRLSHSEIREVSDNQKKANTRIEQEIRDLQDYLVTFTKDAVKKRLSAGRLAEVERQVTDQIEGFEQQLRTRHIPKKVFVIVSEPEKWGDYTVAEKRQALRNLVNITILPVGKGRRNYELSERVALDFHDDILSVNPEADLEKSNVDLDSMTVPQLRQYARNVGLSSITRLDKKQELVVAIKRVQEKYPGRYV
jgi:DNA invertase Pin-like site-specific DNA recombinase